MTTIGELAARHGITLRAIRFYESRGLITCSGRQGAGKRIYNDNEAQKLAVILEATALGFSLAEIPALLSKDAADVWSLALAPDIARKQLELMHARMIETTTAVQRLQAIVMGKAA